MSRLLGTFHCRAQRHVLVAVAGEFCVFCWTFYYPRHMAVTDDYLMHFCLFIVDQFLYLSYSSRIFQEVSVGSCWYLLCNLYNVTLTLKEQQDDSRCV